MLFRPSRLRRALAGMEDALQAGHLDTAAAHAQRAFALAQRLGDLAGAGRAVLGLAHANQAAGMPRAAFGQASYVLAVATLLGDTPLETTALALLGALLPSERSPAVRAGALEASLRGEELALHLPEEAVAALGAAALASARADGVERHRRLTIASGLSRTALERGHLRLAATWLFDVEDEARAELGERPDVELAEDLIDTAVVTAARSAQAPLDLAVLDRTARAPALDEAAPVPTVFPLPDDARVRLQTFAVDVYTSVFPQHPGLPVALLQLASYLLDAGRLERAEGVARAALAELLDQRPVDELRVAQARERLARILLTLDTQGRPATAEALVLAQEAYRAAEALEGDDALDLLVKSGGLLQRSLTLFGGASPAGPGLDDAPTVRLVVGHSESSAG